MAKTDLEVSAHMGKWGNKHCYRYIRAADRLPPTLPEEAKPMGRIHLFDVSSGWQWIISSYDPDTRMAFGLVRGWEVEYGYIDMQELTEYEGRFGGLPIERDKYWRPLPLRDVERNLKSWKTTVFGPEPFFNQPSSGFVLSTSRGRHP